MKKLIFLFFFSSMFGYAQIDYKKLIKHLDIIGVETNLKTFFNDIPFKKSRDQIELIDERFLRYHNIVVDKVLISTGWYGKKIEITPFDNIKDFNIVKTKLTQRYGTPDISDYSSYRTYVWRTDAKTINLKIEIVDDVFTKFRNLVINFKK